MNSDAAQSAVHRVRYREQQVLQVDDLSDEQHYRIAMRRRHNIAHHDWGIVSGLELAIKIDLGRNRLYFSAGMAIDGYGRELIVPRPRMVDQASLDRTLKAYRSSGNSVAQAIAIELWLLYDRNPACTAMRYGQEVHNEHNRWSEIPQLMCSPSGVLDPCNPLRACESRRSSPVDEPNDDPDYEWPVYLGRVYIETTAGNTLDVVGLDERGRRYVGLVGERIEAASRQVAIQLGAENDGDRRRFAISSAQADKSDGENDSDDSNTQDVTAAETTENKSTFRDLLVVERSGSTEILTDFSIKGNLSIANHWKLRKVDFLDPAGFLQRLQHVRQGRASTDKVTSRLLDEFNSFHDERQPPEAAKRGLTHLLEKWSDLKVPVGVATVNRPADLDEELVAVTWLLNGAIETDVIYGMRDAVDVRRLRPTTRELLSQEALPRDHRLILNRLLLEDMYPRQIRPIRVRDISPQGLHISKTRSLPEIAMPWQIYRTAVEAEDKTKVEQLRLEIGHPGKNGDPRRNMLVIGESRPDNPTNSFVERLIVRADSSVEVRFPKSSDENEGSDTTENSDTNSTPSPKLLVKGQLIREPIPPDPDDPRFFNQLLQRWADAFETIAQVAGSRKIGVTISGVTIEKATNSLKYSVTVLNRTNNLIENISLRAVAIKGLSIHDATLLVPDIEELQPGVDKTAKVTHAGLEVDIEQLQIFFVVSSGDLTGYGVYPQVETKPSA